MKVRTMIVIAAAAILPSLSAFADKYDDLATEGYRWVTTDGPFACTSKDDANRISKDQSDQNTLRMVRNGGVYFLIRGVIVRVVQEDKASGFSQVHWPESPRIFGCPVNFSASAQSPAYWELSQSLDNLLAPHLTVISS